MNDQTYDVNSRYAWDLGSKLDVYSRSQSEWYIGTITGWYIDQETNKEWFIVRYDGNKTKLIQRLCKDIKPLKGEIAIRYSWNFGSECSIYSRSRDQWFNGKIFDIYIDPRSNEEWLIVKYNGNQKKTIQRLCDAIKPIMPIANDVNDEQEMTTDIESDDDDMANLELESKIDTREELDTFEDYDDYHYEYDLEPSRNNNLQSAEKIQLHRIFGDRRKKVDLENRRLIIKCIGKVVSLKWKDKKEGSAGTATVFKYNEETKCVYAITCAHNVLRDPDKLDEEKEESDHYEKIIFQRKMTKKEKLFSKFTTSKFQDYPIINYYHLEHTHKDCCDNDLAILIFKDQDGYYKDLFTSNNNKNAIQLFSSDELPENHVINYEIYGYPHFKPKFGASRIHDIWGMMAPSYKAIIHKQEMIEVYFKKHTQKDKSIFKYNAIDTEGGQSGSAIFTSFTDGTYGIVGVHTSGGEGDNNWGVALNQERIDWINKCIENNDNIISHNSSNDNNMEHKCQAVRLKDNMKGYRTRKPTVSGSIKTDDFNESALIESIEDDVWSDFKQMLNSIGWNQIPDNLATADEELCQIISMMINQQTKMSRIRKKDDFINLIQSDNEFYNGYKQYIDAHFND